MDLIKSARVPINITTTEANLKLRELIYN